MSKTLKKMGYESGAAALESEGLGSILSKLKEEVNGDEVAFANLFSSVEAKNAVLALTGAQAENFSEKTAAMAEASGIAQKAFDTQTDSVQAMAGKIKNAGLVMLTSIGEKTLPYISKALDKLLEHLPEMEAAFSAAADEIGPLVERVAGKASELWQQWKPVVQDLGSVFAGIGNVAGEVFPVVAGIILDSGSKVQKILGHVSSKADFLREVFEAAGPAISSVLSAAWSVAGPILDLAIEGIDLFASAIEWAFPYIQSIFETVWSVIEPIVTGIGKGISILAEGAGKVKDFLFGSGDSNAASGNVGHNATGTSYWRGGYSVVGENGPEIVELPGGSRVYSNSSSKNMLAGAGGYGGINIHIDKMEVRSESDIDSVAQRLMDKIDEARRNM